MPLPEGLVIGSSSKPWKIGRQLGSGACGSVHELIRDYASSTSNCKTPSYAVKIAPLPKAKAGKPRKGKKTAEQRNADLLNWEHSLLSNHFCDLRGNVVPNIPFSGSPPCFFESNGFRFLVMERMASPITDVVPLLLKSSGVKKVGSLMQVPFGDIAVAMLNCIQSLHVQFHLFVDVKPENFMLSETASSKGSGKSNKSSSTDVSRRVRLIDFGLVESYVDATTGKQRDNMHPDAPLVGTPSYASLGVMNGHTASRRDDLEALGYVISELIIMINSGSKRADDLLPWAHGKSDEEVGRIKEREMDERHRSSSSLFEKLKAAGADKEMNEYFSLVQSLSYRSQPDYEKLHSILKKLVVTVGKTGNPQLQAVATLSPKVSTRQKKTRVRRGCDISNAIEVDSDEEIECSPEKKRKGKNNVELMDMRSDSTIAREVATQTNARKVEVVDMDWEVTDENKPPAERDSFSSPKSDLKFEVTAGPHREEMHFIGGDYPETLVVGRDPTVSRRSTKDVATIALSKDCNSSATHAKLVLHSAKNTFSVRVTDMKSTNGTFIDGSRIPSGKSQQAFISSKIRIGDSIISIRRG